MPERTGARIPPGNRQEIGWLNSAVARLASRSAGAKRSLDVFTTLGRERRLFRAWMFFAGYLTRRGSLAAVDRELLILRVASNCGSAYEWSQHVPSAERAGLSGRTIDDLRVAAGGGLNKRQMALRRAADELHRNRRIGEETWVELAGWLDDGQLIELCMLVGHYEMLAMTLNSVGLTHEPQTQASK